ncbi:MAG: glycosyltransferase [Deltaproteobacteria bacterium]|nr:glycosyltransferase [Deltaproteobacteria bacterium]
MPAGSTIRIAYIHTQPFGALEAGTVFVTNAVRGLAEAGAKTLLIVPDGGRSESAVLEQLGLSAHPDMKIKPLPSLRLRVGPFRPSWAGPFRGTASAAARAFNADAVMCRDLKVAQRLLADRFPGRIIFEAHNVYGFGENREDLAFFPKEKLAMHKTRIPRETKVFAGVDGIITLTQGLADLLLKTRPLSQRVLAAGSACRPLTDPPGTADRRHIAYVGALDPHKGVGSLVRALGSVPQPARLLIFGKGRHVQTVKEMAKTAGVLDRIDFAGFVPPVRLPDHLARCRAGAVPLVDCFYNRYVTSPMKVFDYLASGVPPAVPDFPVFREIFPDPSAALFFEPGNDESLAGALTELFRDDGTFRRRHLAALHQASEWTWAARGAKVLEFTKKLAKRNLG